MIHSSRPGRLRLLARRRVAARPLHLGAPRALNLTQGLLRKPRVRQEWRHEHAEEHDRRRLARRGRAEAWPRRSLRAAPAATYKLSAAKSGLKFNKSTIRAKAGKVTLSMSNPSSLPHAVGIKGKGKGKTVTKGGTSTFSATLKKGTYTFYCPVGSHEGRHEGQADRQLILHSMARSSLRAPPLARISDVRNMPRRRARGPRGR